MSAITRLQGRLRAELVNAVPLTTHALAALLPLLWSAGAQQWTPPLALFVAAIVIGNLADVDTTYSHVGRLVYPLSRFIEKHFGHRNLTHSLLALGIVGIISHLLSALSPAWALVIDHWPIAFYASHLILDMIIGTQGVPLLWPAQWRFTLLGSKIKGGSSGERWALLCLATVATLALYAPAFNPERLLHRYAATTEFALVDYRRWEGLYRVYADVEGTWQDGTHRRENGRFEIVGADGYKLILSDGRRTFTAGEVSAVDFYVSHIVTWQGEPLGPVPSLIPTHTPVTIVVRIPHVHDPDREILVKPGDTVTVGQILADLQTYRTFITATPGPTPLWLPDPVAVARADVNLAAARIEATRIALTPDPAAIELAAARIHLAELERAAALRVPPTPTPFTPAVTEPDPTCIRSLVPGRVADVRIASITGNEASVEIIIEVEAAGRP